MYSNTARLSLEEIPAWHLFVLCLVTQSCLTLCDPVDCSPPGSSVRGDSPSKNTRVGCHALLQGIFPTQGSNPGFTLQAGSLPSEPPEKPKNTGVGGLSLLQGIFLTEESNWGLLHCRWILYQPETRVSLGVYKQDSPKITGRLFWDQIPDFLIPILKLFLIDHTAQGSVYVCVAPPGA